MRGLGRDINKGAELAAHIRTITEKKVLMDATSSAVAEISAAASPDPSTCSELSMLVTSSSSDVDMKKASSTSLDISFEFNVVDFDYACDGQKEALALSLRSSMDFEGKPADIVIHCAALCDPWAQLDSLHRVNVEATQMICAAAIWIGVGRFIHIR